jgi:hypothetical protein
MTVGPELDVRITHPNFKMIFFVRHGDAQQMSVTCTAYTTKDTKSHASFQVSKSSRGARAQNIWSMQFDFYPIEDWKQLQ